MNADVCWLKENALFNSGANSFDDNHGYRPVPVEARTTDCTFCSFNVTNWIGIVSLPKRRFPKKCVVPLALILTAAVFAYVGSIGPFNMLIGSCIYQYSSVAWINEIGCWIYCPLRALPLTARDALNDNYVRAG